MSVAAASGAVSAHQPTPEQIRLARLIEDKKHDQPEVQEIIRKVLDVVTDSNQDDALLALYDCDYDFEKAVALLIEKGHDVASEWRTATNHKISKKQQQKQTGSTKNRHDGFVGHTDENGQHQQRTHDGSSHQRKSRGGRANFQQQNGADFQNVTNQPNEHFNSQPRPRGGRSNYRGRYRGNRGGPHRGNDRNHPDDSFDPTLDSSSPSDTATWSNNVPYQNRRGVDTTVGASASDSRQLQEHHFDVGNWNGETLIYSRTKQDDEQSLEIDLSSVSKSIQASSEGNAQQMSLGAVTSKVSAPDTSAQSSSQTNFDPVEAALQIKSFIGIGQNQQQNTAANASSLGEGKSRINNQMVNTSSKQTASTTKSPGQVSNNKVASTPPPRIPQQPVVFSDRFDAGLSKIDVQFGNLEEGFDDTVLTGNIIASSNINTTTSSVSHGQRSTPLTQHAPNDQSSFMTSTGSTNTTRVSEQLPVSNQRFVSSQLQQPMPMKTVVPSTAYTIHQSQSQLNPQSMVYPSIVMRHLQNREVTGLESTYDPSFQSSSDFHASYYMSTSLPSQQQTHYMVPQAAQQLQQVSNTRPSASNNGQTSVTTSSSVTSSSGASKKGPPPGFVPQAGTSTPGPGFPTVYPNAYGLAIPLNNQQQTASTQYTPLYDHEHPFNSSFIQYTNPQSAQSPTDAYGSIAQSVPQQNQQGLHGGNDHKTINMPGTVQENLLLIQQNFAMQHQNSQQQAQQGAHSVAQVGYYVSHPTNAANFSPSHGLVYTSNQPPITHQQTSKQQGQHYNQRTTPSSNKEGSQFIYVTGPGQSPQNAGQSVGQQQPQQSGGNKQQRANNNVYNNQQNQQRSYH